MKKIKITEKQAKRLKLLNEDLSPVIMFEKSCNNKIQQINKIYLDIATLTIGEILSNESLISNFIKTIEVIDDSLSLSNSKAYQQINNLPDDNLDIRIDSAKDRVQNKLNAVDIILNDLEKLKTEAKTHRITASFSDIETDITHLQK